MEELTSLSSFQFNEAMQHCLSEACKGNLAGIVQRCHSPVFVERFLKKLDWSKLTEAVQRLLLTTLTENCSRLRSVVITNSSALTNEHLVKLVGANKTTLASLQLVRCTNLVLEKIFSHLGGALDGSTQLKHLALVQPDCQHEISNLTWLGGFHLPQLVSLTIHWRGQLEVTLPNLQELHIRTQDGDTCHVVNAPALKSVSGGRLAARQYAVNEHTELTSESAFGLMQVDQLQLSTLQCRWT